MVRHRYTHHYVSVMSHSVGRVHSKVHSPGVTVRIGIAITSFLCPHTTVLQGTPGAYTALAFANYISHHGPQLPQI